MTDSQCVDYLENICKMFVNGSKNCEGSALEYQQKYISAIRYAIAKLQSSEVKERRMTNKELANHLRDKIKDINHEITIPQSDEAKCLLDGKRKAFQYVLDLLEVKNND